MSKREIAFDEEVEVVREGTLIEEAVRLWLEIAPDVVGGAVPELAADDGRSMVVGAPSISPLPCCYRRG